MSDDVRQRAAEAIEAEGTPEAEWLAWPELRSLPSITLPAGPVLVVAAHPDDEVLGFGGSLVGAEQAVHVVSITDGEASHPHSTQVTAPQLAEIRSDELHDALSELGLAGVRPERLRVPDTQVDRHEDSVAALLAERMRHVGAALCVAPWTGDLHSDHEATGRAAATACSETGTELWQYPVWMWHWAHPADPRVPWSSAARLPLTEAAFEAKAAAIECFRSQILPQDDGGIDVTILPPDELAHHLRPFEVVFR